MTTYIIGQLKIGSEIELSDAFTPFKSGVASPYINIGKSDAETNIRESDTKVNVRKSDRKICVDNAEFHIELEQVEIWKLQDGYAFRYKPFEWESGESAEMQVDDEYQEISILRGSGEEYLIRLALESRLVKEGFISLHSSCIIAPDKKAVCMTGKSGIGKSTRAAAWVSAMNLEAVSGDRPLIDTKTLNVYGVPWDGKEGIHRPVCAPLGCILDIVRADGTAENVTDKNETCINDIDGNVSDGNEPSGVEKVRLLDKDEAYKVLIAQTFMPMWDTDLAATAMSNLKRLCGATSIDNKKCMCEATDKSDGRDASVKIMELTSNQDEASAVRAWKKIKSLS